MHTGLGCTASRACSTSYSAAQCQPIPRSCTDVEQLPNGPDDGGLKVMNGTAPLFEQYFKEHSPVSPRYASVLVKNPNTVSLRVAGSSEIRSYGLMRRSNGFKIVDANG